jgi:hypothetical protein
MSEVESINFDKIPVKAIKKSARRDSVYGHVIEWMLAGFLLLQLFLVFFL